MKRIKILSVLLAVLIALTCISVFPASAALIKTISSIEFTEVPNDIYTKNPDEMLYGIKLKVTYTDKTSKVLTVSASNADYTDSGDYLDSYASSYSSAEISAGLTSHISLEAYNYTGDFIQINATVLKSSSSEKICEAETKFDYPDNYQLPEIFCNDYLVYKDNGDNTLTMINRAIVADYHDYDEDYTAPTIVIPEEIHGKTVTSVANYALLGSAYPSSVTIPDTVTSIGEYAFGYSFVLGDYGYNNNIPENVANSFLAYKLPDADDNDPFLVEIRFYSDNAQAASDSLHSKYLSDCDDYEYDEDLEIAYATITKAQIYSMQDVEDIFIELLYERDTCISEEVYDFAEYIGYDKEMCVEVYVYTETDDELDALCKELSKKYFGGRTDYIVDYEYSNMRIDATFDEIKAASMDDSASYINLYCDELSYQLYKKLYFEDSEYKTDVFVAGYSEESSSETYAECAETYFPNCDYEIKYFDNEELLIIKDTSKQQILNANQNTNFYLGLFDYPLITPYYDIVIHGKNGSTAQSYAEENSIEFVGTGSQYQLGDVNLDGVVSVIDATDILKYNVELITFTDEQKALADFDQNGTINVSDASEIQRAIVNS